MAKKKTVPAENAQEIVLIYDPAKEPQETDASAVDTDEPGLVRYRVTAPRGIYIRVGPGRAYQETGVLPNGAEIMGVDLAGMLRPNRKPGEPAWLEVLAKDESGWVDSAFLERIS